MPKCNIVLMNSIFLILQVARLAVARPVRVNLQKLYANCSLWTDYVYLRLEYCAIGILIEEKQPDVHMSSNKLPAEHRRKHCPAPLDTGRACPDRLSTDAGATCTRSPSPLAPRVASARLASPASSPLLSPVNRQVVIPVWVQPLGGCWRLQFAASLHRGAEPSPDVVSRSQRYSACKSSIISTSTV